MKPNWDKKLSNKQVSSKADELSNKAKKSGQAFDHKLAMQAHNIASQRWAQRGHTPLVMHHRAMAKQHSDKLGEARSARSIPANPANDNHQKSEQVLKLLKLFKSFREARNRER